MPPRLTVLLAMMTGFASKESEELMCEPGINLDAGAAVSVHAEALFAQREE